MALTRAQLLAGNQSQGIVLPGQVQAVTAGAGVDIDANGVLSLDGSDPAFNGFIKTNNQFAFNAYVWPGVDGTADQFLQTDGAGNLTWADAAGFAVVTVDPNPPTPPDEGELWYDCNTGYLKVYQNCVAPGGWTNVSEPGKPVLPANTSAFPVFTGGNGTQATPYDCTVTTAAVGSSVFIINTVTITGLAPYQYVPIVDLNAVINGGRFSFSNYYANAGGTLIFQTIFKDQPASPPLTAYTAAIKVGYGTVYIDAVVNIVTPVSLTSPGTISGTPEVGATLTYTPGTAVNGVAPYSYAWEWRKLSDGTSVLSGSGTAPQTYVVPTSLIGDNLYVELTVTDNIGDTDSGVTSLVPTPPATIQKGPFPATTVNFPTTIPGTANTTWNEAGTTSISSNGCLRFSVNGSPFGQGPTNITLNDTLTTEWIVSPTCGGANSGTTIQGCLFSANYEECSSFAINRIPGTFPAFTPNTGVARNAVSTSNTVTPTGYNSTAYVTRGAASTGTVIEGSIDGGTNWAAIPASGTTFPINPGQTLTVRQTVGNSLNTPYDAIINIGDSTGTTTQTFTATTVINAPITGAVAPTTIPGTASFTWADAPATLTAGGCIEFSVDAGANWVTSASVTNAPPTTVLTRWVNTPSSGTCGDTAGNAAITGTLTSSTGETNTFNLAMNRTPSAFTLVPNTDSTTPNTVTTANPTFTIAGTNSPSYIWGSFTTTGGTPQYSVDGGTNWAAIPTAPGTATVNPGATVKIRFTTGAAAGSEVYTVNVGASTTAGQFQSGAFTVTVATAPFPSFATTPAGGPNASPETTALSGPSLYGTATGGAWADGTTSISATGSLQYKIGAGAWGQSAQTVNNGNIVSLRWDPTAMVAVDGTILNGTLTNGTYTNSYTVTVTNQPAAYTWTDVPTGAGGSAVSTLNTSNVVNITGINAPAQLIYTPDPTDPLTSVKASINGGGWTTIPTTGTGLTINPADTAGTTATTLQIQGITGPTLNTAYKITTKIGDGTTWVTDEWSVGTIAATPAVQAPNIVTPSAGSTGQGTVSGITITAGAYSASGGAGAQTSSTWEVYKNAPPLTSTNTISAVTPGTAGTPGTVQYKNASSADLPSATYQNAVYGKPATDLGATTGNHPMFTWADALTINGYNDWYIPSQYELAILYFFLKPDSTANTTVSGSNPNSVAPYTPNTNYSFGFPNATGNALFAGGVQAFSVSNRYWASTEKVANPPNSWNQLFSNGDINDDNKNNVRFARAIRRIPIAEYTAAGSPAIGSYLKGGFYGGQISTAGNGTADYALIVAPAAQGTYGYTGGTNASLTIAGANTNGFAAGMQIKGSTSSAVGIILSVNATTIEYLPVSGTFTTGETIITDPASYSQITGSPFTVSTGTLTSLTIAKPPLEANTKYWVRAQYTSAAIVTTSPFGGWSDFTTGSLQNQGIGTLLTASAPFSGRSVLLKNGSSYIAGSYAGATDGSSWVTTDLTNWTSTTTGLTGPGGQMVKTSAGYLLGTTGGPYFSANGTSGWSRTLSFATGTNQTFGFIVNPSNPSQVVATEGNSFVTNFYYSSDGGQTWGAAQSSPGGVAGLNPGNTSGTVFGGNWYFPSGNGYYVTSTPSAGGWTSVAENVFTRMAVSSTEMLAISGSFVRKSTDGTNWSTVGSAASQGMISLSGLAYVGGVWFVTGSITAGTAPAVLRLTDTNNWAGASLLTIPAGTAGVWGIDVGELTPGVAVVTVGTGSAATPTSFISYS